jgi:hypothetical protein
VGRLTGIILVCGKTGVREWGFLLVWGITVGMLMMWISKAGRVNGNSNGVDGTGDRETGV